MLHNRYPSLLRYLCAPVSVALALVIRMLLDPLLGDQFPLATVFMAIAFTAWYGGLLPALLAIALGYTAGDYFFLPPLFSLGPADAEQVKFLIRFIVVATTTALLGGAMQLMRMRAEHSASKVRQQAVLIDQVYDAVVVWDWHGAITFWNRGAEQMYGFTREQALGRASHELLDLEVTGGIELLLQQLETEGRWEGELRHRTRSGQHIWVESRMMLIREAARIYVVETNRDVTVRKALDHLRSELRVQLELQVAQRTAELSTSEEQFRVLIEGIEGYAILMLDPDGVIQAWSKSAERIGGYRAEEIVGQSFARLFTPQDIEVEQPAFELAQARASGKLEIDGWRVRKNGTHFWVNGTIAALHGDDDRLVGYVKVMRDVTEKRRNDELLYSVLDNALDAIVSIDVEGTISLFNRAGETMFGRSAAEVMGRNIRLLLSESFQEEYDDYLDSFLRAGSARSIATRREVYGMRKDGSTFPIELAITGFELDQQRYFICILRDTSERKNLEEQLRQSQKLEAFGQLAGGVAHDFNNLLMVISGYSSLLLDTLDPADEPHRFVAEIRRAGERAARLTRQLLAFSRQQMLEPRVVSLNEVVRDVERMLMRVIGEDVQLQSVLAPDISSVKIDPGQIEQVIMNLVVNARDAMPNGGKLTIETAEVTANAVPSTLRQPGRAGGFVVLIVSDTGHGMSADVKARIFEPFFTTKGVGKGTGLGLAVVHGIVKQSGGSIDVQTEVDRGTVFRIYLPAVKELPPIVVESDVVPVVTGTETILLVEDDDKVRELVSRSLQSLGYRVLHAVNGRDALRVLDESRASIDLLLTDVVMPEMSGSQLADIFIRRHEGARVLFVSGYTDDAVLRHGVLEAEAAFLQKPFTLNALAIKVRETLNAELKVTMRS